MKTSLFATGLLFVAALGLPGCSTSTFKRYDLGTNTVQPHADFSRKGQVLLVIRYPSRVGAEAIQNFSSFYDNRGIGNYFYTAKPEEVDIPWSEGAHNPSTPKRDIMNAWSEAITKTNYLALAVYESLRRSFPEGSIRLQPVEVVQKPVKTEKDGIIAWGESWPVTLAQKTAIDYPPAPIYLDLFVFVNPYYRIGYYYSFANLNHPTSFGKYMVPLVSVRTAPAAAPQTQGALALSYPYLPYTRAVRATAGADQGMGVSYPDYLSAVQGVPADAQPLPRERLRNTLPLNPGEVLVLGVDRFELPGLSQALTKGKEAEPEAEFTAGLSQVLTAALGSISIDTATEAARRAYAVSFDPALAGRMERGPLLPGDTRKIEMIRKMESLEWSMIARQDEDFVRELFYGKWGAVLRQARIEEETFRVNLEDAREAAQWRMAASGLGSAMSGMGSMTSPMGSLQMAMNSISAAMQMTEETKALNRELAQAAVSFQKRLRNEYDKILTFAFEFDDQRFEIQATTLGELRTELQRIYKQLSPKMG